MSLETIFVILTSSGFLLGIAVIIKTILDHKRGVQSTELDATAQHLKRLDDMIVRLELNIQDKERQAVYKEAYISELIAHINAGNGPPAPRQTLPPIEATK